MSEITSERLRQIIAHQLRENNFLSKKLKNLKDDVQNVDPLVILAWERGANELAKKAIEAGRKWNTSRTANRDYLVRYVKTPEFKHRLDKFMSERQKTVNEFLDLLDRLTGMKLTIILTNGQSLGLYPFGSLREHLAHNGFADMLSFHQYFDTLQEPVDELFKKHGKADNEWFQSSNFKAEDGSSVVFRNSAVAAYIWDFDKAKMREALIFGYCERGSEHLRHDATFDWKFVKYHISSNDVLNTLTR